MKRSYTLVRWAFNIAYYTWSSLTAYFLVRQTSFMPHFLGGSGSVYSLFEYRYLEEATPGMKLYYCIQMGKHLARYFAHVFLRPEGSYYEYCLHHSLASFLIFFSYAMNMWTIGLFVLFVHDFSDVFLALGRGYNEYKDKNVFAKNLLYSLAFGSWILFRVFIFSYCCVYTLWYQFLFSLDRLTAL